MASISSAVAARRKSSPITWLRRVPWPTYEATLSAVGLFSSDWKKGPRG